MSRVSWPGIALALLCAACAREPEPPMRVGTLRWPSAELLFLASHRGRLPPADFRLVEFVDDGEAMRALRNGTIEAAHLSLDEVVGVSQSDADPVILFLTDRSAGGDAVMARPGVTTMADLRGRRIAAQVGSVGTFLLSRALAEAGMTVADVQMVNLPPYRQIDPFLRGEIDAAVTHEPLRSAMEDAGAAEVLNSRTHPGEPVRVLVVRRDYLTAHQHRARQLCAAWRDGLTAFAAPESRAWIAARMGTTPAALEAMMLRLALVSWDDNRRSLTGDRADFLRTTGETARQLAAIGSAPATARIEALLAWPDGLAGECAG
jgi:NitT/TauT family transport system substrate-binding protein